MQSLQAAGLIVPLTISSPLVDAWAMNAAAS